MDRPLSTISTTSHLSEKTEQASSSHLSARETPVTPAHKTWTAYAGPIIFTGPSGLRDQRVRAEEFILVGEAANSTEITTHMAYLNRPAPGESFPKAKNGQVGEIGWIYDTYNVVKGI